MRNSDPTPLSLLCCVCSKWPNNVRVRVRVRAGVWVGVRVRVRVRLRLRLRLRLEGGAVGSGITILDKKACEA